MRSVASAVANLEIVLTRVERYLHELSVNEIVRDYRNTLENLVVDAANGLYANRRSSFVQQMQTAIIDSGQSAYVEGLGEGGREPPTIEKDDEAAIRDWTLSQTDSSGSFADDALAVAKLDGDERTAARNAMLTRVGQWVESLAQLGRLAELNASGQDMYLTYDGEDGLESCAQCQKFKGQRHKKSWWESRGLLARFGNPNFDCGRWENCHHNYYDDAGKQVL